MTKKKMRQQQHFQQQEQRERRVCGDSVLAEREESETASGEMVTHSTEAAQQAKSCRRLPTGMEEAVFCSREDGQRRRSSKKEQRTMADDQEG